MFLFFNYYYNHGFGFFFFLLNIKGGLLFIFFATGSNTFDSVVINLKITKDLNCYCNGKTLFRGRQNVKIDFKIKLFCSLDCEEKFMKKFQGGNSGFTFFIFNSKNYK
jgi:hypothetical protein